jgi:hypothetical protein
MRDVLETAQRGTGAMTRRLTSPTVTSILGDQRHRHLAPDLLCYWEDSSGAFHGETVDTAASL